MTCSWEVPEDCSSSAPVACWSLLIRECRFACRTLLADRGFRKGADGALQEIVNDIAKSHDMLPLEGGDR